MMICITFYPAKSHRINNKRKREHERKYAHFSAASLPAEADAQCQASFSSSPPSAASSLLLPLPSSFSSFNMFHILLTQKRIRLMRGHNRSHLSSLTILHPRHMIHLTILSNGRVLIVFTSRLSWPHSLHSRCRVKVKMPLSPSCGLLYPCTCPSLEVYSPPLAMSTHPLGVLKAASTGHVSPATASPVASSVTRHLTDESGHSLRCEASWAIERGVSTVKRRCACMRLRLLSPSLCTLICTRRWRAMNSLWNVYRHRDNVLTQRRRGEGERGKETRKGRATEWIIWYADSNTICRIWWWCVIIINNLSCDFFIARSGEHFSAAPLHRLSRQTLLWTSYTHTHTHISLSRVSNLLYSPSSFVIHHSPPLS